MIARFAVFVAALGSVVAFGAGLAGAGGKHGGEAAHVFSFGAPGKARDVSRTIAVKAGDMNFQIESLRIRDGETIRFVVSNVDEIDHDFTIGPPALQARHRAEMMEMMQSGQDMAKLHDDANAVYLKPGETKELIWSFRNVARLEFACNVPGHYEAGMRGRFHVDPLTSGPRHATQ
ncbi:MAG: copper-binding protein [Rhodospirillales bacterium]|nr:MAG: copper-binding protein [Rhodospirillales bacterium]